MSKKDETANFIITWQGAKDIDVVCAKLKISKAAAMSRARFCREKGVNLKTFGKSTRKLTESDWVDLAALVN